MDLEPMSIEETHSVVNPGVPSLQTDPLIYDDTIDTSTIQNVLFIDSSVKHFQEYANATTFPIVYSCISTREEMLQLLSTKFQHISRIAIVCHFREEPYFLNSELLFSDTNSQFMIDLVKQFNVSHLDYLACSTLQNQGWKDYYAKLHEATGITVGASDDDTGNLKYGGDWILESTQEDIQTVYFNDLIQNYASLLAVFTVNGIKYNNLSTATAEVSAHTAAEVSALGGIINIPSSVYYNGTTYNVVSIAASAFRDRTNLTSITIPSSVTTIDTQAFQDSGLTSLTIPSSVTTIGSTVFRGCTGLTSVILSYGLTSIGLNLAFQGCSGLTSIIIPSSVTSIPPGTFQGCSGLTSVTIPSSVTNIGLDAFSGCNLLTRVSFLHTSFSGLTITGPNFFKDSSANKVDTSYYNASITDITKISGFFVNTPIGLSNRTSFLSGGLNYTTSVTSATVTTNSGKTGAIIIPKTIIDPSGIICDVTTIGSSAFSNCQGMTSITIPSSVTTIGSQAFFDCRGLTSVTIPSSVTLIEQMTFYACEGLTNISVDTSNPNYSSDINGVLFNRSKTTLIQYTIGNVRTAYTIPSSVTSIQQRAFFGSSKLTSVTIPSSVTTIENNAFFSCSELTSVILPTSGLTTIGEEAFRSCIKLTSIIIPNSVTSIGSGAFKNCNMLNSVILPMSGLTSIGNQAFESCIALTSITFPSSVTTIGSTVFNICSNLTSVTLMPGLTTIGHEMFMNCSSLTSITIPSSVTLIGSAFKFCPLLTQVSFLHTTFANLTINGPNFVKAGTTPVDIAYYNSSITDITKISVYFGTRTALPDRPSFFDATSGLNYTTSVTEATVAINSGKTGAITIPPTITDPSGRICNVTSIGLQAFQGCSGLTSISIPSSVTTIGSQAFSGTGLTSITIPLSVTKISQSAFQNCTSLPSLTIPSSVTSIEPFAFQGCIGLTSVILSYGLTNIGINGTFSGCSGLTSVTIPSSVTSICTGAFQSCSNLSSIIIPSSVTTIGANAFISCSLLTNVYFLHKTFAGLTINTPNFLKEYSTTKVNNMTYLSSTVLTGSISNFFNSSSQMSAPSPTNLTGSGATGRVNLSWIAATAPAYSVVTGYTVTYWVTSTPGATKTTSLITGTSTVISGLLNLTSYTFQVVAYNNVDNSGPSPNFTISTLPAAAPVLTSVSSIFSTVSEDASNVPISWATNMLDASYSSQDGAVNSFIVTAVTSANGTLKIGTNAGTAVDWHVSNNNTIDVNRTAYWTPTTNLNGTSIQAFKIAVKSDLGMQSTNELFVNINVTPVNDPPTVANIIPAQTAYTGVAFDFSFNVNTFADVDIGNSFSYSVTSKPSWLTFTSGTRTFTGTPQLSHIGTSQVTVVATDSSSATISTNFNITVNRLNNAPTVANAITSVPSATQGSPYSYTFPINTFYDADVLSSGDSLSYTAFKGDGTSLSGTWLSTFNASTRTFTGTPQNANVGIFNVKIRATDTANASVDTSFNITVLNVNDPPTMSIMTKSLPKYDTSCNGVTDAADIDVGNTFTTDISGSSVGKYGSLTITSSTLTAWRYDLSSNSYNYKMLPVDATDTDIFNITVTDSSGASVTRSLTITVTGISNPQISTQLSGKIVDGYIKYGSINVRDLSNNVIAGPAQTDSLGNYSIDIPVSIPPISYIIECIGGTDIATNLPLNFPLKTIYTPVVNPADFSVINSSNVCLTPLTTIVANIVTSTATGGGSINGTSSASTIAAAITAATNKVATALDISANVVNTDYIAINTPTITNIKVAAAAVKMSTITDIISTTENKVPQVVLSVISTFIQQSSAKITIDNAFVTTAGGQTPITNLTPLVTTIVTRIDAATTLDSIYTKSIAGNTVASTANATFIAYTAPQLTAAIDGATPSLSPGVISNICFKAGTKIVTDQGIVNIERITEQNSIRGKKVLLVSQTTNIDDYMVKIEKGALYENVPNADTWLTGEHKVFFNKEMIKSKSLVNGQTIVRENKISEVVYNILLEGENSGKMIANGMISETLSPTSVMVQLLVKLNKLSDKDRERDIIRINKLMTEEKERMKSGASRRP